MSRRTAGVCYVKVDGAQLEISGGVEAPLNSAVREAVMSVTGVAGYKETAQRPFLKVETIFTPDFPIAQLRDGTNMTITSELANGMVYTLSGAHLEGETTGKGVDGKVDLEFSGSAGVWR